MNKEGLGGSRLGRLVLSGLGRIWAWKGGRSGFAVVFGCFLSGGVWFGLRFASGPLVLLWGSMFSSWMRLLGCLGVVLFGIRGLVFCFVTTSQR